MEDDMVFNLTSDKKLTSNISIIESNKIKNNDLLVNNTKLDKKEDVKLINNNFIKKEFSLKDNKDIKKLTSKKRQDYNKMSNDDNNATTKIPKNNYIKSFNNNTINNKKTIISNPYSELSKDLPNLNIKKDEIFTQFSLKNFSELPINNYLVKALTKSNYTTLTKIQKQAIPVMLEHKNVVVKSETGSGKTLAYLIPLYESLIKEHMKKPITRLDGIYSIIFSPTHELCLQIENTINKIRSSCISVVSGTLIGGQKIDTEKLKIRKGVNIIICTPGRLLYHIKNSKNLKFQCLKCIVFDEADLLLDMGFEKDIKLCLNLISKKLVENNKVISKYKVKNDEEENDIDIKNFNAIDEFKKIKLFLISATLDNKIRDMASFIMKGFKSVGFKSDKDKKQKTEEKQNETGEIANGNDISNNINDQIHVSKNLRQFYCEIYDEFRLVHLISFLFTLKDKKVIIFLNNCDSCDFHASLFLNIILNKVKLFENVNILRIHGKMKHNERLDSYNKFNNEDKSLKNSFMFATDVIARGLDFPNVDWVIHYDLNPNQKDYLNRLGRTARLNSSGNSLIFLMPHEYPVKDKCLNSFTFENISSDSMLIRFANNYNTIVEEILISINSNKEASNKNCITNYKESNPENSEQQYSLIEFIGKENKWEEEIDINEKYRKKYSNIIYPLANSIKDYIHYEENNLASARKALKCSLRAYTTYKKYAPNVFNLNTLHLTRFARAFGLYKESLKYKLDNEDYRLDQRSEINKIRAERKFHKNQKKMEISEFK